MVSLVSRYCHPSFYGRIKRGANSTEARTKDSIATGEIEAQSLACLSNTKKMIARFKVGLAVRISRERSNHNDQSPRSYNKSRETGISPVKGNNA